jgi:excinuclease ABC subunit C
MNDKINAILETIPEKTGIYMMKDDNNEVIYIGKSTKLKTRVRSYFQNEAHSAKIQVMVPKIDSVDFITTDNEVEALILEDTLIKKYQPRYNTLLKDDKKFPWIEITDEDYPRIFVTRNPAKKSRQRKNKYFGPYVNAGALYATLDFLKLVFPLKQCKTPVHRDKPCMNYHILRCLGPCQQLVTPEEYKQVLKQVELFLSGKQAELLKKLEKMMQKASDRLEFEKAAKYRDTIHSIQNIIETQKIVSDDTSIEQDIFAFASDKLSISVVLLKIREGKLTYKESFDFSPGNIDTPEEVFWKFLEDYYTTIEPDTIPKELIVPWLAEETEFMEDMLSDKRGSKVKCILPRAGKKLELLQMAEKNARIALENYQQKVIRNFQNIWNEIGCEIQTRLKLPGFPLRLECFDISHLSGTDTVASMVVFIKGKPQKSDYRKYKIKSTEGTIDDFTAMHEVIKRRFARLLRENKPLPDLIVIDGGKGQLSSALKALGELDLFEQPVVSLAKKFEEVFIPGSKYPVIFEKDSPVLYLFQQIRDEAHRFAISFQRDLRSKRMVKSKLDSVKFIGKKRKARLIEHFGSVDKVLKAPLEELASVRGLNKSLAERIYKELHNK